MAVKAGENVGIYGLMGAGRTELLECTIGRHPVALGRNYIDGIELRSKSIANRIRRGIALVPEDRKNHGLVQIMSIRENLTLFSLKDIERGFHLNVGRELKRAATSRRW